jgi:uncharacterized DUF497 family protein
MISSPFVLERWLALASRMAVLGPRLGTLLGTVKADANVCVSGTRCAPLIAVKCFAWDDAKNAKLKADRGIGFEDVVFHIERGDLLDSQQPQKGKGRRDATIHTRVGHVRSRIERLVAWFQNFRRLSTR